MSLEQTIEKHWDEIVRKRETVSEALSWSPTGRQVAEASTDFAQTPVMQGMMAALANDDAYAIDRFKISQYFAQALEGNIMENLRLFADYLYALAKQEEDEKRRNYYDSVGHAIVKLRQSEALTQYVEVYNAFLRDTSEEAKLAKGVMKKVTQSVRDMMGVYAV